MKDNHNNTFDDFSKVIEILSNSDKVINLTLNYIALQHNHGQIIFSSVPCCNTEKDSLKEEN